MRKLVVDIVYGENVIKSLNQEVSTVSFGALDRGNVSDTTNWGCFSNVGEVEFFDNSNDFETIISSYPNADVVIYYYARGKRKRLATFKIDDFDYNYEQKKVSLKLKDQLIDYQNQNIDEYYTFTTNFLDVILCDIFPEIQRELYSNDLGNIAIATPYITKGSKWSAIDKICQASMNRCFCDENGKPLISGELNARTKYGVKFIINPRNILSIENHVTNRQTRNEEFVISANKYTKHRNEPVAEDFPFTFFDFQKLFTNVDYPELSFIYADWADYKINGDTNQIPNATIDPTGNIEAIYWGASVSAQIKDNNNHVFRYLGVDVYVTTNSIQTNAEINTEEDIYLQKETKIANEDDYTITVNQIEKGQSVDVTFKRATASRYDALLGGNPSYVGDWYIEGGKIVRNGTFFTEDGEEKYGSDSDFATTITSNELIQTESKYYYDAELYQSLSKHIYDTVKRKYSNGVECVVMDVTPSEYVGTSGETINPYGDKPLFEKYDVVIPYVVRNGKEQPYSTKEDGSPKSFKVVGIEYYYKGFLKQRLHLQENTT